MEAIWIIIIAQIIAFILAIILKVTDHDSWFAYFLGVVWGLSIAVWVI